MDGVADHYRTLGVAPKATNEELRSRYFELVRQLHGNGSAPDEERLKAVNAAYHELKDPTRRRAYDKVIGGQPSPTTPSPSHQDAVIASFLAAFGGPVAEQPPRRSEPAPPPRPATAPPAAKIPREDPTANYSGLTEMCRHVRLLIERELGVPCHIAHINVIPKRMEMADGSHTPARFQMTERGGELDLEQGFADMLNGIGRTGQFDGTLLDFTLGLTILMHELLHSASAVDDAALRRLQDVIRRDPTQRLLAEGLTQAITELVLPDLMSSLNLPREYATLPSDTSVYPGTTEIGSAVLSAGGTGVADQKQVAHTYLAPGGGREGLVAAMQTRGRSAAAAERLVGVILSAAAEALEGGIIGPQSANQCRRIAVPACRRIARAAGERGLDI